MAHAGLRTPAVAGAPDADLVLACGPNRMLAAVTRPLAGKAGRRRDIHGLWHRRVSRLRGPAQARRLRPCVQEVPSIRPPMWTGWLSPRTGDNCMTADMSLVRGAHEATRAGAGVETFGHGTEDTCWKRRALGGMVSKGIFRDPAPAHPAAHRGNAVGDAERHPAGTRCRRADRLRAPKAGGIGFPVLVSINGESVSRYSRLTARLDGVPGVAGFGRRISCPNVEQGGLYFRRPARSCGHRAVRQRGLPVWVKLRRWSTDIGVIARAVESAGADALCTRSTRSSACRSTSMRTGEVELPHRPLWAGHPPTRGPPCAPSGPGGHPCDRRRRDHPGGGRARVPSSRDALRVRSARRPLSARRSPGTSSIAPSVTRRLGPSPSCRAAAARLTRTRCWEAGRAPGPVRRWRTHGAARSSSDDPGDHSAGRHRPGRAEQRCERRRSLGAADGPHPNQGLRVQRHDPAAQVVRRDRRSGFDCWPLPRT